MSQIEKYADFVHMDLMDGHFVPNLGLCLDTCKSVCKTSKIPCIAHLMVTNPDIYVETFGNMGAYAFVWHIETNMNHLEMIQRAKQLGMKAGLAISPDTEVEELGQYLNLIDMVTIMGVYPGRSGQKFLPATTERVSRVRKLDGNPVLEVDGGVSLGNAKELVDAGADILVSGSSFIKSDNKSEFSNFIHSL